MILTLLSLVDCAGGEAKPNDSSAAVAHSGTLESGAPRDSAPGDSGDSVPIHSGDPPTDDSGGDSADSAQPVDADRDGYPPPQDCDDDDASVFPVTFTGASSTPTDVTAWFSSGSAGAPANLALAEAGTYTFCDGTYYLNLSVLADITLDSVNGALLTTLSAGGTGSVVRLEGSAWSATIEGLTLADGDAQNGGAIDNTTGGTVVLSQVVAEGNRASACGGAVASYGGELSIDSSDVVNNVASTSGGGICCYDCNLDVNATDISDNGAGSEGGGLYLGGFSSTMTVTGSTITNNGAPAGGGAWHDMASPRYQDSYITDNTGGGFTVYWSAGTVVDCTGGSGGVLRNTENGASMDYAAWFSSVDCDWGTGADDNTPYDVNYGYSYGAGATFSCGWVDGCS